MLYPLGVPPLIPTCATGQEVAWDLEGGETERQRGQAAASSHLPGLVSVALEVPSSSTATA